MASSRRGTTSNTASSTASDILDAAERLVQSRGFNGFSYADVSSELGITKAALHYHFAGKAELGESLISRYNERFDAALAAIDAAEMSAPEKLLAYCDLYRGTLRGNRMCLCGMLAAEYNTLGEPMRDAIRQVFRPQPGLVGRPPGDRSQGRGAGLCRAGRPSRPDHRRGPRGSDAGGPSLPRHRRSRRCHRPALGRLRPATFSDLNLCWLQARTVGARGQGG